MQCLFKRSSDEVLEGSPNGRFCLRFRPPPAPQPVVLRGFWGRVLHQAIHAGRPKGPAYWCSLAQWTTLKGWGEGSSCMCKASVFDSALWTGAVMTFWSVDHIRDVKIKMVQSVFYPALPLITITVKCHIGGLMMGNLTVWTGLMRLL